MFYVLVALLLIRLTSPLVVVHQQGESTGTPAPGIILESPQPGQALQGKQEITGSVQVPDFRSAELLFAYADDPTNTWFLIQEYTQPITTSLIAQWDTTTISDGVYALRLIVTRTDGSQVEQLVSGLRVRNYTAVETNTPTPITPTAAPQVISTATPPPTSTPKPPTATALPPNPARVTSDQLGQAIAKGALGVFGAFALLALYSAARSRRHK